MPPVRIEWRRVFMTYFALAAASLAAACFTWGTLQSILVITGIFLLVAFVPLIMLGYFLRGFMGLR